MDIFELTIIFMYIISPIICIKLVDLGINKIYSTIIVILLDLIVYASISQNEKLLSGTFAAIIFCVVMYLFIEFVIFDGRRWRK